LIVEGPERYLEPFADAGASIFTFHPDATRHVQRHLARARQLGMRAGLALNPGSSLQWIEEVQEDLDLLLLMTVNPGFGGQRYIPASTGKIRRARQLLDRTGREIWLEVDGGITPDTIAQAFAAGADTFVAGSAVFGTDDPAASLRLLRRRCAVTV
jgi:ribulose-phosphate 3-epimerase